MPTVIAARLVGNSTMIGYSKPFPHVPSSISAFPKFFFDLTPTLGNRSNRRIDLDNCGLAFSADYAVMVTWLLSDRICLAHDLTLI